MLGAISIDDPYESYSGHAYNSSGGGYASAGRGYRAGFAVDAFGPRSRDLYNLDPIFDVERYADRFERTGDPPEGDTAAIQPYGTQEQPGAIQTTGATNDPAGENAGAQENDLLNDPLLWVVGIVVAFLVVK